jgi:hypothetical protein
MKIEKITLQELKLKPNKVGIYEMSAQDYHAHDCPGLTRSDLMNLIKSYEHYTVARAKPDEPTPAMELGSATHYAILEPELFNANVIEIPEFKGDGSRKAKAEFEALHAGKIFLKKDQMLDISRMIEAVYSHKEAAELLTGIKEKTFVFDAGETLGKCRPDVISGNTIVDLKTVGDISLDAFERELGAFGYYLQAAYYTQGVRRVSDLKTTDFKFLCVEKSAPYKVAIRELNPDVIDCGDRMIAYALKNFKEGPNKKYRNEVATLPAWMIWQMERILNSGN